MQVVSITFYDHSSCPGNETGVLQCTVYGLLYEENELSYHVASWVTNGNPKDHNSETFAILKSAVIKVKKFK
jgi:hypothetical protein